ncbi:ABC transporter permease [Actinoplanes sp. TBRC 11911]|uniref:carboxypeptidase regulatory-like domain-containing protein n=1 Tax=Actinoplanes sp. TBRC 11911 TaxID=2729386 RepID=UPI00145DD39D|nr:carboxypeptidase regulatory-like domain-containing protein [Actinoplanes sp. TBRC 11911]NMO51005.1 ABC transporter permease [Actinoplanes sp. TBRC 11911]
MNHTAAPQPTRSRIISLLWFPFFFAAATALVYSFANTHPQPHDVRLGVIGTPPPSLPAGIDVEAVTGTAGVAHHQLAGVYDSGARTFYVSSAASASRANYLNAVLHPASTVDVVPLAHGDVSGAGLFFFGLPLLLVGLITSIVLLQFGMWPVRRKVIAVFATGAFAAVVTFVVGVSRDVIPADGWLLLYGFALTQAIGWLTTALPRLVRQFFLPVAMTFVLILGIPTAGATVNPDMLPTWLRWLHDVLPFGQFVEAARDEAYFGQRGLAHPLIILGSWVAGSALLLAWTARPRRSVNPAAAGRAVAETAAGAVAATRDVTVEPGVADHVDAESVASGQGVSGQGAVAHRRLHGTVRNTGLIPVSGATVLVLNDSGDELHRTMTHADGTYAIDDVRPGLHHLVVTAAHHEPEIVTIAVRRHRAESARDITLTDWDDPAGNLTAEEIADRRAPIA